jgi:hypothetical protein
MKHTFLVLLMAASTVAASAQTPAPPAAAAKPAAAAAAAKPAAPAAKAVPAPLTNPNIAPIIKTPAEVTKYKGLLPPRALFTLALRSQEIKVGTGAPADPGKLAHFKYTLWWLATDGPKIVATEFDASVDHPGPPVKDKDGKPVVGDDGKPKLGDPQPMSVVLGQLRPLAGWDLGAAGMKAGGMRRVFIPWQLGFGAHVMKALDPTHAAIPAKSDLIMDLELVDVGDPPQQPQRPGMGGGGRSQMMSMPHPAPGAPGAPSAPAQPGAVQPAAPAPAPGPVSAPKAGAPATPPAPAAPSAAPAPAAAPAAPAPAAPAQPPSK